MNKSKLVYLIGGVALFIFVIIIFSATFMTIDPGYRGVLFEKFSGQLSKEKTFAQGFHVIAPWNEMYLYDTRIQEKTEEMDVLARNGLSIHIDLSFRYKVVDDEVGYLHEEIGPGYEEKIVIPEIRAATRNVIGKYLPEELYSSKREVIQTEIFEMTETSIHKKHLLLDAVLIRSVKLPQTIEAAIERKLKQEQESKEYEFRLTKETQEAKRKEIEAEGIKKYQEIVSQGLTEKFLKWKGIEATEKLANSPNSKTVVIGGSDGLPLILNQ